MLDIRNFEKGATSDAIMRLNKMADVARHTKQMTSDDYISVRQSPGQATSHGLNINMLRQRLGRGKGTKTIYAVITQTLQREDPVAEPPEEEINHYHIELVSSIGATLAGAWIWTNASASVTTVGGTGGDATKLAIGDYVRLSDGSQWYKVASVVSDNSFTITPVFQQATHTDDNGMSLWRNILDAYVAGYPISKSLLQTVPWFQVNWVVEVIEQNDYDAEGQEIPDTKKWRIVQTVIKTEEIIAEIPCYSLYWNQDETRLMAVFK